MIIFAYGFKNEIISVIKNDPEGNYKLPYISDQLIVRKLVNLVLNKDNNYKLIILDGKHNIY